jgi:CO/xanthine dehydrogenase FAD-binding subunit
MTLATAMAAKKRSRRTAEHRGTIMTTIELPPDLHEQARIFAVRRRTSLRALVERGLRDLLRKEDTRP